MLSVLLIIAIILLILWLLGLVAGFLTGPILWIILVIGIIFLIIWFVQRMKIRSRKGSVMNNLRQVERLSNQHWTMVYLSEMQHWRGEGVIVETDGHRSTALIPDIGLETRLNCQSSLPLNTRVPIVLGGLNIPELRAFFRIDEGPVNPS